MRELRAMGETVVDAADEMDALLDGLMVLARSDHGVSAHGVARPRQRGAAPPPAASRSSDVRVRLDLQPAGVHGERRLLERLATNLIENGVKYNAPGGFVRVRTRASEHGAVLDVENSGPLVDPRVAARLTEPFERGGRVGRGGSGLGLSIVRSVAEAHGGRLSLSPARRGRAGRARGPAGRLR